MAVNKDSYSHHISQQFNAELDELKGSVLTMGGRVEKQVNDAITALIEGNSELAQTVRRNEGTINQMEVSIDEECTRILARRQPTASDLRLVLAVTRTTTDLERIGDESNKIAKMAMTVSEQGHAPRGHVEIRHIGGQVAGMLHNALDAFARLDVDSALGVARADAEVDLEYGTALRELITYMMEDPRSISRVMEIIWALRALERVGDHARNIAEQVIFLLAGHDVRHASYEEMEAAAKNI